MLGLKKFLNIMTINKNFIKSTRTSSKNRENIKLTALANIDEKVKLNGIITKIFAIIIILNLLI